MSNPKPQPIQWNQPATQRVGLEESLDSDDTIEHSQLPAATGFNDNVQSSEQLAYVQRCLLQIKDRMVQQVKDSEYKSANNNSRTPTPSEDLAYAVQTAMINTNSRDTLKKSKHQPNLNERDLRQAKYMLEQAARDEQFDTDQLNGTTDDSDTGNPFMASAKRGGDIVMLEEQIPQLDWLGQTLDKHYGADDDDIGKFNSNASFKDKLDYVYKVLKQKEEKKYRQIKRVIPNVQSPDDDDMAYGLALKGAISHLTDKIKQEQKKQSKLKSKL